MIMMVQVLATLIAAVGAAAEKPWVHGDRMTFTEVERVEFVHPITGVTVINSTYNSPPLPLKPGQVVFTNAAKTPLMMPEGAYAIVGFHGEVVDAQNRSVPLSSVYDHHWIAEDEHHQNYLCPGGPNYVFGIGAESRNSPVRLPAGHGYKVKAGDAWGGNIHLLHTEGLKVPAGGDEWDARKQCNECYYAPFKGPKCTPATNGTFDCCGDKCYDGTCSCPTDGSLPKTASTYYLRYTVSYTRDEAQTTNTGLGVWTTPNCNAFYSVLRDDANPEHLSSTTFVQQQPGEIVFAIGHQHTGAINISLFVNDEFVCASYPTYGSQIGVAGDEKGFLTTMSTCLDKDVDGKTVKLAVGDKVRLDSWYWVGSDDPRIAPFRGGTHLNVMGYMYAAFTSPDLPPSMADAAAEHRNMSFSTILTSS
eukprot:g2338.t1